MQETDAPDRLVSMANQIGLFFVSQRGGDPADAIARHLKQFWDPRMRRRIQEYLLAGGLGLDPMVRDAVLRLAEG